VYAVIPDLCKDVRSCQIEQIFLNISCYNMRALILKHTDNKFEKTRNQKLNAELNAIEIYRDLV